ncbi:MAG: NOL1/NOP2/sun family putative RNA methylase, partial [Nitrospirae bacterium]|nr:NOL1/NOP2/sun family putative RNA methylase [Nitrospirota bacterium]
MENHFLIYRDIIPDFDDFLESLNIPHPSHLRVNTIKTTPEVLIERLKKYNTQLTPLPLKNAYAFEGLEKPGATIEYFLGFYHLQGLSSMLPPLIMDLKADHSVLDMCASPGSKTTQISALMNNRGLIVANELNRQRLSILKFHIERLGVTNVVVTNYQAQNFPMKYPDGTPLRFDRVLLDAPCTGEGRFRKILRSDEAEKMRPFSEKSSWIMSRYQKQMILKGFDLLREGGIMVYSTCTYSPYE